MTELVFGSGYCSITRVIASIFFWERGDLSEEALTTVLRFKSFFFKILQIEAEQLKKTNSNLQNQQSKVFSPSRRANFPQDKMLEFRWMLDVTTPTSYSLFPPSSSSFQKILRLFLSALSFFSFLKVRCLVSYISLWEFLVFVWLVMNKCCLFSLFFFS